MNQNQRPLFVEEVAAMLRCPVSSVRGWISAGRLATIKPGKRRMVLQEDLEVFLGSVRKEERA